MKKILMVICLFIGFSVQAQQNTDRKAILQLLEQQRQGWNKADFNAYMDGYLESDSLLFVGKNGPTYGYKATLENYRKNYPSPEAMGYLSFDIQQINFLAKDAAFVLGGWHLKRTKGDLKGAFTLILKKLKGQWKIIVDHSS